ncbi:MAG: formylglycine-generating enzyme family protein [Nitrospirae bacterium]|nr:formylglycine-generating enzyme family protein [Nitrospirota bacterium]
MDKSQTVVNGESSTPRERKEFRDLFTGTEFVYVKGGCYKMGDTLGGGDADEKPVHKVCVDDFYMAKYDVTVSDFRRFVNDTGYSTEAEKGDGCYAGGTRGAHDRSKNWKNPGFSQEDNGPVVCVTWNDAQAYAEWVREKSGKSVRLPTEGEWEYAARSGGRAEKYAGSNDVDSVAWYTSNSGGKTHAVGTKAANWLGLYDMSGNIWQWTADWYGENYYGESPENNPQGPGSGQFKVLRGGSWYCVLQSVRVAVRHMGAPSVRIYNLGFRLAFSAL